MGKGATKRPKSGTSQSKKTGTCGRKKRNSKKAKSPFLGTLPGKQTKIFEVFRILGRIRGVGGQKESKDFK